MVKISDVLDIPFKRDIIKNVLHDCDLNEEFDVSRFISDMISWEPMGIGVPLIDFFQKYSAVFDVYELLSLFENVDLENIPITNFSEVHQGFETRLYSPVKRGIIVFKANNSVIEVHDNNLIIVFGSNNTILSNGCNYILLMDNDGFDDCKNNIVYLNEYPSIDNVGCHISSGVLKIYKGV